MLKLYFVRHGETLSNVWHYMQGHSDTPLTENGRNQAKQLAQALQEETFLALYTSTSERAYDTACLLNEYHHLPLRMCKGLKEMNFGMLEAHPEHIIGGTPAHRMNYDWTQFGGENINLLTQRIGQTLEELVLAHQNEEGNILCVSHSIAILSAIRYIDQAVYDKRMREGAYLDNCSLTILAWDKGTFTIEDINRKPAKTVS